ncbi:glycosyltransferase [Sulfurifustis variabilis]|uniref:Glycosyltransferase n=1 Tax=Sulfurifustis variabilis TaxID=1675686 RepID=A0A1B4V4Y6_9GAMM|nr:glycosyltransferase family 4 protein [Sulfurifustis variabilis]BAU48603.1 glycosyltransferase [Sulfurifustis variabilis]
MKIGFLGNANNYPFMLARAVRRLGHDVTFIVANRTQLDRPENRYPDLRQPYPQWIRDVGNFEARDYVLPTAKRRMVVELLRKCDAVILNQNGPALLPLVRRPAVVLLTGADLEVYGNIRARETFFDPSFEHLGPLRRQMARYIIGKLIKAQRAGIRAAYTVNYFAPGLAPSGDALLSEIGVSPAQRVFFMMTELERIPFEHPANNDPPRIFCATRLSWMKPIRPGTCELDYKGSDVMIKGLARFHRQTGVRLEIRLVKKGLHVAESIRLAEDEGLSDQVTWLDEMSQADVWYEFRQADIVFEQMGKSVVGMAGLDAMAMGRPVIANGRPEIMEQFVGEPSPICQAETPEEVAVQLIRLVGDPAERERVGRRSRQYVERHFSADRAAELCLERLQKGILSSPVKRTG